MMEIEEYFDYLSNNQVELSQANFETIQSAIDYLSKGLLQIEYSVDSAQKDKSIIEYVRIRGKILFKAIKPSLDFPESVEKERAKELAARLKFLAKSTYEANKSIFDPSKIGKRFKTPSKLLKSAVPFRQNDLNKKKGRNRIDCNTVGVLIVFGFYTICCNVAFFSTEDPDFGLTCAVLINWAIIILAVVGFWTDRMNVSAGYNSTSSSNTSDVEKIAVGLLVYNSLQDKDEGKK